MRNHLSSQTENNKLIVNVNDQFKQESIPVVPSAAVAAGGGVSAWGLVCPGVREGRLPSGGVC